MCSDGGPQSIARAAGLRGAAIRGENDEAAATAAVSCATKAAASLVAEVAAAAWGHSSSKGWFSETIWS